MISASHGVGAERWRVAVRNSVNGWALLAAAVMAVCLTAGCQTTPETAETAEPAVERSNVEFVPASYLARLEFAEGRNPTLFSPETYAVWTAPDVIDLKRRQAEEQGQVMPPGMNQTARLVGENYIIFELHLTSAFEDTSIAYDAVGLRGIDAHLELPDGTAMRPLQRIITRNLRERPEGALRRFQRTIILVFPRRDFWAGVHTIDAAYPAVRLVLSAHHSEFYFEWPGAEQPGVTQWSPTPAEAEAAGRMGYREFFNEVRRLGQHFH